MQAEHVQLRDGTPILVRPLTRDDRPLIADGFARLSAESRRLRFLTTKAELTESELRYLTAVDGHDHVALAGIDPRTEHAIGIARFVRDRDDEHRAEIAVTVADDWQRRGVATLLLDRLAERAREEGVERFTALVASDNRSMQELLGSLGAPAHAINVGGGAVEYEIEIAAKGLGAQLEAALRAAAAGRLRMPPSLWEALRALVPIRMPSR